MKAIMTLSILLALSVGFSIGCISSQLKQESIFMEDESLYLGSGSELSGQYAGRSALSMYSDGDIILQTFNGSVILPDKIKIGTVVFTSKYIVDINGETIRVLAAE